MNNPVAIKWHILYGTREQCDTAINELNAEYNKLTAKINEMRVIKRGYEENVIPCLSDALSQIDGEVKTTMNKARNLLAENYKGDTTGVREVKDNLDKSNRSICSVKNKIVGLQRIVKANVARINKLISELNQEKGEVKKVRSVAVNAKYTYLSPPSIL